MTRVRHFRAAVSQLVTAISYADAAARSWDVVVLATRPEETDSSVLAFAAEAAPIVATMSQVPGDLDELAGMVP